MSCEGVVALMTELLNACELEDCDDCDAEGFLHWPIMVATVLYLTEEANSSTEDQELRADE